MKRERFAFLSLHVDTYAHNKLTRKLRTHIINKLTHLFQLTIVRQRDKLEPLFQQYLMEDRGANGSASYVDYLCHVHKEIRNLLS